MIYFNKQSDQPPISASPYRRQKRLSRLVDIPLGLANVLVLGLSLAFSNGAFKSAAPQETRSAQEISKSDLFKTLGSEKFADFQREYAQEKIAQDLTAAEQAKAEAEDLKMQAAADVSKAKDAAQAIRLEASYDGVEQRYHRPEGFVITLNYPTTVEKEQTEFGFKATARPTTQAGTVRVYINLATVNEGLVPAGSSIGTVGRYPVGEGVKTF